MKAIILTRANRDKILDTDCGIKTKDLDLMIEEYDSTDLEACLLFVPDFKRAPGPMYPVTWATFPREAFEQYFEPVDMVRIQTDFVDVVPSDR